MLIHFGYSIASVHFISPKHHIESSFEADGEENQGWFGITVLSSACALPHGVPRFSSRGPQVGEGSSVSWSTLSTSADKVPTGGLHVYNHSYLSYVESFLNLKRLLARVLFLFPSKKIKLNLILFFNFQDHLSTKMYNG